MKLSYGLYPLSLSFLIASYNIFIIQAASIPDHGGSRLIRRHSDQIENFESNQESLKEEQLRTLKIDNGKYRS
jgi:hypothetical protein